MQIGRGLAAEIGPAIGVDRLAVDADIFGFQLAQIDSSDRLAVYDEQKTVASEQVGQDGAGTGAFDHGVDGINDSFEAVEALDALDDALVAYVNAFIISSIFPYLEIRIQNLGKVEKQKIVVLYYGPIETQNSAIGSRG